MLAFNKIEFDWDSPEIEEIPGVTRSFIVRWIPIYMPEDLRVGYHRSRKRRSADSTYTLGLQLGM